MIVSSENVNMFDGRFLQLTSLLFVHLHCIVHIYRFASWIHVSPAGPSLHMSADLMSPSDYYKTKQLKEVSNGIEQSL